jgi:hypothetical protein
MRWRMSSLLSDDNLLPKLPETYSFLTECDTQLLKVSLCDASMQPANCLLHVFKFLFQGNLESAGEQSESPCFSDPCTVFFCLVGLAWVGWRRRAALP